LTRILRTDGVERDCRRNGAGAALSCGSDQARLQHEHTPDEISRRRWIRYHRSGHSQELGSASSPGAMGTSASSRDLWGLPTQPGSRARTHLSGTGHAGTLKRGGQGPSTNAYEQMRTNSPTHVPESPETAQLPKPQPAG